MTLPRVCHPHKTLLKDTKEEFENLYFNDLL